MKPLHSRLHGVLDYLVSVVLMVGPPMLEFPADSPEALVPLLLGMGSIVYSLLTDYELGALRLIPFRVHLTLDAFHGVFLALSPWLLGFAERVYVPHLLAGLAEIGVVMLSEPQVGLARQRVRVR